MSRPESLARRIFGERAQFYSTSATHTDPQVLARVVELAQPAPDWVALDVATGTGHTAFALAPHVVQVNGIDLTPEMLAEARRLQAELGISNVEFRVADVHALPFDDGAFDLVTSRRAPHHFSDIAKALCEIRRVLRPGGRLVIDDRSVAEDEFVDAVMNELDRYHDASHVREYPPREWRRMLSECGFAVETVEPYQQHRPLTSFTAHVNAANVAHIQARLAALNPQQRAVLRLAEVNGESYINHWFVMLAATAV